MGKIIKVREVGDSILEKQCDEVNIKNINEDIIDIIEDLKSTLEYGTRLGIAAPQIGVDKRIIVVGAKKENIKYNDAEEINKMTRYLGVQFIIATHSPFMLGILNAKIYNLDTKEYKVQNWSELENVRYFYDFFKSRKNEFEK